MNKLFTKVATLSIGLAMAIGVGVALGSKSSDVKPAEADSVVYTFQTPANSSKSGYDNNYEVAIKGVVWSAPGSQTAANQTRIGGKNVSNVVRVIYSKEPVTGNMSNVEMFFGTASSSYKPTVNSITLNVYSTASGAATGGSTDRIDQKTFGAYSASSSKSVTPTSSGSWTDRYYRFELNITQSNNSGNGYITLTEIEFTGSNGNSSLYGEASSFTSINTDLVTDKISYAATQGSAGTAPKIDNSAILVYQNGGLFTVSTASGYRMTKIIIGSSSSTTVSYSVDGGTAQTGKSIAQNGFYSLPGITASQVVYTCTGTTSSTRLRIVYLYVEYRAHTVPSLTLSGTPTQVGIGNTASFTVNYANLSENFIVSTDTTYVTASYTGASGTGSATVTLRGEAAVNSTTITVSATGVSPSPTFNVKVAALPIIDKNFGSLSWNTTAYADGAHILTMDSTYTWGFSAGQKDGSNKAYLGANTTQPSGRDYKNSAFTKIGDSHFTMTSTDYSSLNTAMADSSYWSTYGAAIRMLNFGIVKPTSFSITIGALPASPGTNYYYLFASVDSGDTWTKLTNGTVVAETPITWSNASTYASETRPVQFALVITNATEGKPVNSITVEAYGSSLKTTKVLSSIYVSGTPETEYFTGETFDIGSAKVYARYTDSTTYPDEDITSSITYPKLTHGTTSVTLSYGGKSTSAISVTVIDVGDLYKKTTSTSELLDGSKVVIGTTSADYLMGTQGQNNRSAEDSDEFGYYESGGVETWSIDTQEFTVGVVKENSSTYYTFKDSDDKYLYAVASSNNYLRSSASLTDACKWTITYGDSGSATITTVVNYEIESVATDVTKYMGKATGGFGCYTSSNNLSIYVDVTTNVDLFVVNYMHTDIDYDDDPTLPINNTGDCHDEDWYVDAKAALLDMGSDYVDEFKTNDRFANPLERYYAWAKACGDSTPFAGNGIVPAQNILMISALSGASLSATIAIIIISSVACAAAMGGYFLFKKKKQN